MSRTLKIVLAAALVVVVASAAGIWWYLRDDAPPEVSLETAVDQVDDGGTDDTSDPTDGTTADTADQTGGETATGAIDGTWVVDAESGDFDFESATGTFVGFRIAEELASIGSTTAVGRTGDVSGSITIDGTTLTAAEFEVDLTTVTTNESRRDDRVQQALETTAFPTATFTLTDPVELGEAAATGEPVSVTAVGELTIHGVTQPAEVAIDAQLEGDTVVVVGTTAIEFADFDVEVPDAQVVLSVDDQGTLEMQLLLTRS